VSGPLPSTPAEDLVYARNEGPLVTIAPTGAGKGRSVIIPTLLSYRGSAVVIDPKGEAAAVTARWRQQFGPVAVIDPFEVVTDEPAQLNPIDALQLVPETTGSVAEQALALTEHLKGETPQTLPDPYWDNRGAALISGIIAHILTREPKPLRHLSRVRSILSEKKVDLWLEVVALGCDPHPFAEEELRQYLSIPEERTRPAVLSIAQQHTRILGDPAVTRSLSATTFDLDAFTRGDPATIYLVLPPEKLRSHAALLRLWMGSLIDLLLRRRRRPPIDTLLLVDEAAQLGPMDGLRAATTLLRGYGLRVWSFWQDLSQLRRLYPEDWPSMLNNATALQVFGASTYQMAREVGEVIGAPPEALLHLGSGEQLIAHAGGHQEIARKADYLTDPVFEGRFDANPLFATQIKSVEPAPESPRA
jgi:type IV secretion system protein VirD4